MPHMDKNSGSNLRLKPEFQAQAQSNTLADTGYVGRQQWERALLSEAEASMEEVRATNGAGCLTLEELTPWMDSWGTDNELPPPFPVEPAE